MSSLLLLSFLLLLLSPEYIYSYVHYDISMVTFQSDRFYRNNHYHFHHSYHRHHHDRKDMKLSASTSNTLLSIDSTTLSIIAGAIGGAIGVGKMSILLLFIILSLFS